jgi:hypothetical protein
MGTLQATPQSTQLSTTGGGQLDKGKAGKLSRDNVYPGTNGL